MPYCPKCKNEYTEGITICADCKVPLVNLIDDLPNAEMVTVLYGETEDLKNIVKFLEYAEITSCVLASPDDYENENSISVSKKEEDKTRKLIALYRKNKREELLSEPVESENTDKSEVSDLFADRPIYENKTIKLDNLKSSAYTLLLVGIVGIIVVILAFIGVIDFNLSSNMKYIIYSIMGALFLVFVFFGTHALLDAKKVQKEAIQENDLTAAIKTWFLENFKLEQDDLLLPDDMEEEVKYFKRTDQMKHIIREKYDNAEEDLLDSIVDELYQEIYEA